MAPDPKPKKRHKWSKKERVLILERKMDKCRVCGTRYNLTAHHLVSKSLRGDDYPDNIVPLCGSGTTGCHGRVEVRNPATCATLGMRLTPGEYAYVLDKKGEDFLASRYYVLRERAA